jgi:cytochrome c-type biogenesis protein CcmH
MISRSHLKRLPLIFLITALALFTLGADSTNQRFEKVGHELMCTCGCNQVLLECNHVGCPASDGMRNELAAGINGSGDNKAVLQTFVDKYGPTVLAAPTMVGFNRVAWITPFAVFVCGIGLAMFVVRNWKLRPASAPAGVNKPAPAGNSDVLQSFRKRAREETEL